jgi:hypothetical protein
VKPRLFLLKLQCFQAAATHTQALAGVVIATTRQLLERAFSMGALRLPAADRDFGIDGLASRNT